MHDLIYILGITLKLLAMNLKTQDGNVWVKETLETLFVLRNFICSFYRCFFELQPISICFWNLDFYSGFSFICLNLTVLNISIFSCY